ncbi:DNA cytosine methyltransferase [Burkholderia aenigmatica]|uniref:phage integrase central domain-containing protein n=1 Tax=Burkholderia aenigmatica TaxID=2015348 RepID=UPI001F0326A4|nr:integrase arm-type DNA-binding domain-containing protein [Burkholderia aenigmatica]UKD17378.1 DNA cytosine methyltransferase [Burkholderia aenigmatica]
MHTLHRLKVMQVTHTKKPGLYSDGGGLYLQVTKSLVKSWLFRYMRRGIRRGMGLGPIHTVTLAEAREKAYACRRMLIEGIDPLEAKKAKRQAERRERMKSLFFRDCANQYIEAHRKSWKNEKHAAQWGRTIETYANPIIGNLMVAEIDTDEITQVLEPIWAEKTETAKRLRGRIESILAWATVRGFRTGLNPAQWKGHLDHLLAKPSRLRKTNHHAALPYAEAATFMKMLQQQEGNAALAGARQGLNDPRGALTLAYVELANAIDQTRRQERRPPATLVWENVPGVLNDRSNAFGHLLGALAGESRALEPAGQKWTHAGCVSGPRRRIAWRVLDAQYFGVAQRRKRVFLVASGGDGVDPAEVLFEREGLLGDSSAGSSPWQDAARAAEPGAEATSGFAGLKQPYGKVTTTFGFSGGTGPVNVAACLMAAGPKHDVRTETFTVQTIAGNISHTLNTANGGKGSSEDGTGKGIPIIALTAQGFGADATMAQAPTLRRVVVPAVTFAQNSRGELRLESGHGQLAGTLSTGGGKPGQRRPMVASVALRGRAEGLAAELGGRVSSALRTSGGGADKSHVLAPDFEAHFRYDWNDPGPGDWSQWRVRRLMPVECERLQGMPDDYTQVPYRGKPAADAPRYKAIGNAMAVPCMAWLGHRLVQYLHKTDSSASD